MGFLLMIDLGSQKLDELIKFIEQGIVEEGFRKG